MLTSRLLFSLLQSVWLASCLPEAVKFTKSADRSLQNTQSKILKEILACSSETAIALKYKFARIKNAKDFQQALPISEYDDLKEWINRIADGEERVLTNGPVSMFELTSGSTAATKLIPYNDMLQKSFNRALHPWLIDIYKNFKAAWGGPSYWVITPKADSGRKTKGGIPIGFAADSEYFGSWAKHLIDIFMAVPAEVGTIKDMESWKYVTILFLLRSENLRLISLWNPTFICSLMNEIGRFSENLANDLASGKCSRAEHSDQFQSPPMPQRAKLFRETLSSFESGDFAGFSRAMWPDLAFISSWSEAEAKEGAEKLRQDFPHAEFQTKGILATEGAITIPITGAPAPVLAVRSAFFEFIEQTEDQQKVFLAHEVEAGKQYSLVMTTFGGLFRYKLNDIVKVKGFWKNLPCLEFIGKEAMVSDLCGEKLSAGHVKEIFERFLGSSSACFIAPERHEKNELPGYTMFVCHDDLRHSEDELKSLVETELRKNFHYNWCVEAGQLRAVKVKVLEFSKERVQQLRLERLQEEGLQFSTAKTGVLTRLDNWTEWFAQKG